MRRAIAAVALGASIAGCSPWASKAPAPFRLPAPTADEPLVVDGRALSIQGFESVRAQLASSRSEYVVWAATATLVVQNDGRARGIRISPSSALKVVRYALGEIPSAQAVGPLLEFVGADSSAPTPQELRQRLESLMSRSVIQRNAPLLAELDRGVR